MSDIYRLPGDPSLPPGVSMRDIDPPDEPDEEFTRDESHDQQDDGVTPNQPARCDEQPIVAGDGGPPRVYEIVAFMQNPWFPLEAREEIVIRYRDDQEFHRRVLARSMSGGRLVTAFRGEYDKIWWDNANPEAARGDSTIKHPYDINHMRLVVNQRSPLIILSFGQEAKVGCDQLVVEGQMSGRFVHMHCHHPNARGKTQADLDTFARSVRFALTSIKLRHQETHR